MYHRVLDIARSVRLLYLAVTEATYETVFEIELGQIFLVDNFVRLIVFDEEGEVLHDGYPTKLSGNCYDLRFNLFLIGF